MNIHLYWNKINNLSFMCSLIRKSKIFFQKYSEFSEILGLLSNQNRDLVTKITFANPEGKIYHQRYTF